jgi:serine/threonine-protein kinase HipA
VRSGQVKAPQGFGYWLLKFDGVTYSEHGSVMDNPKGIGNIEYAYYKMAQACGIDMTECRLLDEGDNHHFMTRRFDRTADGEKIHMQTVAGLAHLDRDQRHSYEEIFGIIRKMSLPMETSLQLFRRMVFNVMARNNDDHTKNFSFLMDRQGQWKLAPAYDLCYSYKPGGRWIGQHQLSLNGKQDDFTRQDLLTVGEKMGIRRCGDIIEEVANAVSRWQTIAKDCGVRESHVAEVAKNLLIL